MFTPHIDKMLRAAYDPKKRELSLMKVSGQMIIVKNVTQVYFEGTVLAVEHIDKSGEMKTYEIGGEYAWLQGTLPGYWVQSLKITEGD